MEFFLTSGGQRNVAGAEKPFEADEAQKTSLWEEPSKEAAMRHIMDSMPRLFPSIDLKSYQAVQGMLGRKNFHMLNFCPDDSEYDAVQKEQFLRTGHEDLSHLKGRQGLVEHLCLGAMQFVSGSLLFFMH